MKSEIEYKLALRDALSLPDRDGNSVLSCLINSTDYPYWEGEAATVKALALLGIVTESEVENYLFK